MLSGAIFGVARGLLVVLRERLDEDVRQRTGLHLAETAVEVAVQLPVPHGLAACAAFEASREITGVEAGLQTVGRIRTGASADAVSEQVAHRDVELTPLHRYAWGRVRKDAVILGFAAVDARELRRGVQELASVLEKTRRR